MASIKEKTALRETHNSSANRLVPGALEVNMKKARLKGPVFDRPRIRPSSVELGTSRESSSNAEISNRGGTFHRRCALENSS